MNRDKMYSCIDKLGLNHKETIVASQEIDKEVFKEMLKDPGVENIYLKQVIIAKNYEIKDLKNRIDILTRQAQKEYENGKSAKDSIELVMRIAEREGIVGEVKINGIR